MHRSSNRSSRTTRFAHTILFSSILLSLGAASAQVVSVEATSTSIQGRAPVVSVSIQNQTDPGGGLRVGHIARAVATASDPDNDPIMLAYSWTRDGVQVGTSETYEMTAADSGKTLTLKVTASTNAETTDPTTTTATASTSLEGTAPSVANVTVSGDYRVGETLTGSFDFIDPEDQIDEAGMVYQWYISDESTGAETAIPGATGRTYKVASADQGVSRRFWFRVEKAKSLTGTPISQDRPAGQWEFTRNGEVRGRHPTAAPEIIGTPAVGQTLRVEPHYEDLDNDLPNSEGHFYQWIRVTRPDPAEGEGEETGVKGNGRDTYVVKEEDVGKYLQVVMYPRSQTGYPNEGEVKKAIIASPVTVASTAPTANPTIGGTVYVGRTLIGNANYQDVNNDPEGVHEYRWFSADDAAGTTGKTQVATTKDYVVRQEDGDKFLLLEVTPKSVEGTPEGTGTPVTVATSTAVPLPKLTQVTFEGSSKVGEYLQPKWTYSFPEGPGAGSHPYEMVVATAPNAESVTEVVAYGWLSGIHEFVAKATYVGLYYGIKITPVSSDGIHGKPIWAFNSTAVHQLGQAPKANPTLSGTFEVGQTLQGHIAFEDADNDPEGTHVLQWYRADDANGSNKVAIPGATGMSHVVTSEDMSKFIVFGVKARTTTGTPNEGDEEFASTGTRPSITNVDITGTFASGETLTGRFDLIDAENDQIDEAGMEYAWMISDPVSGAPTLIPNSNSRTLVLQPEHAGANRKVWFSVEKAKTLTGIPNESARPTDPAGQWQKAREGLIEGNAPTATPTIEGLVSLGDRLIGKVGYDDAQNDPPGTHTYTWYQATDAQGNNRTPIPDTNYDTYFPQASDTGYYIVFEVIPRSSTGTPNVGVATRAVTATPVSGTAPNVANVNYTGEFRVGETLTASFDFIDPEDQIDEAGMVYQWYISDPSTGAETAIPGATGKTYKIVAADQGANRTIWFRVEKAKSLTGAPISRDRWPGQWESSRSGAITGRLPTVAPEIIGANLVGTTLRVEPHYEDLDGDLPHPDGQYVRWYRQDRPDPAEGEGVYTGVKGYGQTYTLTAADVGKYLQAIVHPMSATGYPSTEGAIVKVVTATPVAHVAAMPTAKPTITGALQVGSTLTGHAGYEDINNDPEGTHVYQWYRADNAAGTANRTAISGATASTYVLQSDDLGKFILLNVTPRSASGNPIEGEPTFSASVGPALVPGAPYATNVYVQEFSPPQVGSWVEAEYTWHDDEGDAPEWALYDWCHVGGECGLSNSDNYQFKDTDVGHQVIARVTPRAKSGSPMVGTMVESAPYPKDGVIGIDVPEINPQWNYSPNLLTEYSVSLNYSHVEDEGPHEIKWYRAPDEFGEPRTAIPERDGWTLYRAWEPDNGQFLVYEVVAKTASGVAAPKRALVGEFRMPYVNSQDWGRVPAWGYSQSHVVVSGMGGRMGHTMSKVQIDKDPSDAWNTRVDLIAPDGTVYTLYNGGGNYPADGLFNVDLSSEPMNGEWNLRLYTSEGDNASIHRFVFKPWMFR